jgi:hypothetical protein
MKIEVYSNGKLLYSITGTYDFNCDDIVIVSRNLIEKATMNAEGFDELFFTHLKSSESHIEAYTKAEQVHFETFGHNKYSDFESFRKAKSTRLKK